MNALVRPEALTFSVSQMKAWLRCPQAFAYRYVEGAEPEMVPITLAFGIAFHEALGHHYSGLMRELLVEAAEVKQRFVDSMTLVKNGPVPLQLDEEGDFDEALAKGLQMLDVTLAHPSSRPTKVLGVEQRFIVDLHDPTTGEVLEEKLLGVLDLVVEEDGHRVFVEHKTAAKKYSANELLYDTQLSGYAYAAAKMNWGEVGLRFQVTTKTKLPALQLEDVRRDDGDQADFLRTAVGVLKAIDAGIAFPVRGWACKGCPYRRRCESER